MVSFSGWELPIQYKDFGLIDSALHTRSAASLFDVSHMGQIRISGANRIEFIESLVVGDIAALRPSESRLSLFTNSEGGIVDDTIITRRDEDLLVVVNAGCFDKDIDLIQSRLSDFQGEVHVEVLPKALLALQGPAAAEVLAALLPKISGLPFMGSMDLEISSHPVTVTRCGYTGEDGFEISVGRDFAVELAKRLVGNQKVKLAGLGARDALRIEAGLCLYGQDIDETTSPVEAGLAWTIGKRRRAQGGFPGDDVILQQLKGGVTRQRVGLLVTGPPAREGAKVNKNGDHVGTVTSGTFSPSLGRPIAIAYVQTEAATSGNELTTLVRDKQSPAIVTKLPFVKPNYYKP